LTYIFLTIQAEGFDSLNTQAWTKSHGETEAWD